MNAWALADHFALGAPFGGGPFDVYGISATGEISLHDRTDEISLSEMAAIDPGGRFFLSRHFPHDIDLYRINPDRTVSHESFFDIADREIDYPRHLALAQDGRMMLALARDTGVDPLQASWETFQVNNRLDLLRTGYQLEAVQFGGATSWILSNQGGYTGVILVFETSEIIILHVSEDGEITESQSRVPTPVMGNHPMEVSEDGAVFSIHSAINLPSVGLYTIGVDGSILMTDVSSPSGVNDLTETSFITGQDAFLVANGGSGLSVVSLTTGYMIGPVLDSDAPGFSVPEALDISADSSLILVDDQSGLGHFSIYPYLLSDDGILTRTGAEYSKPYKLSTLDFIPDLAVPTLPGDANLDGRVDAADVVFLVNEAMPDDKPILLPQNFANADLDGDVDVDQDDLQALVDLLLQRGQMTVNR